MPVWDCSEFKSFGFCYRRSTLEQSQRAVHSKQQIRKFDSILPRNRRHGSTACFGCKGESLHFKNAAHTKYCILYAKSQGIVFLISTILQWWFTSSPACNKSGKRWRDWKFFQKCCKIQYYRFKILHIGAGVFGKIVKTVVEYQEIERLT